MNIISPIVSIFLQTLQAHNIFQYDSSHIQIGIAVLRSPLHPLVKTGPTFRNGAIQQIQASAKASPKTKSFESRGEIFDQMRCRDAHLLEISVGFLTFC